MLGPVNDIVNNWLDPLDEIAGFAGDALERLGPAGGAAADLFGGAVSLAEGYASRTGILSRPVFAWEGVRVAVAVGEVVAAALGGGDRQFDGRFVGANGRTYPPSTPLADVPAVVPRDGRVPTETIVYVNGISTTKDAQFGSLQQIADRTGARVVGIHNATQGGFIDVIRARRHARHRPHPP